MTQDSCDKNHCFYDIYCDNIVYTETVTEKTCVLKSGDIPFATMIQHINPRASNLNITFEECSTLCD